MEKYSDMLQGMVAVIEARLNGDDSPEIKAAWTEQTRVGEKLLNTEVNGSALSDLLNVFYVQEQRESGHYHITAAVAGDIALRAVAQAKKHIAELNATNDQAVRALKQRATAIAKRLEGYEVQIGHCQMLHVLAAAEGHKSFQSLRTKLKAFGPAFCPHCGAAGTLSNVGSVFCEQGEWDGKHYEAEGDGAQYQCSRCQGQFADWCGVDTADKKKSETSIPVYNIVLKYGDELKSFATLDAANSCLSKNPDVDEAWGEDKDCEMVVEFDASSGSLVEM